MRTSDQKLCALLVFCMTLLWTGGTVYAQFGGFGKYKSAAEKTKKLIEEKDKEKEESVKTDKDSTEASPAMAVPEPVAGNIVFSKKPIDLKKPADLTASFKAGDNIYSVVYLKETMKEMANESSSLDFEIKCELDGKYHCSFAVKVKGKALDSKILVLDIAPEPKKMTAYDNPEIIYAKIFEKYGKRGGPMQLTKMLSTLPEGKHTLKMIFYQYADKSVGQFTIDGDFKLYEKLYKELDELNTKGITMPKAQRTDKEMEAGMLEALKASGNEAFAGKILRVVIIDKDWYLRRHELSGAILNRYIRACVAVKDPAGQCWMYKLVTFKEDYIGGKFEKMKYDGAGDRVKIPEENVMKE